MKSIEKLADALKNNPAAIFTGAGVSTNSGIPDFRSETGFYQKYHEDDLSIEAFYRNVDQFYIAFHEKFSKVFDAQPNDTHTILAKLESLGYVKGIITQNVDRLHQKAGSQNVLEFHGNIFEYDLIQIDDPEQQISQVIQKDISLDKIRSKNKINYRVGFKTVYKPNVVLYGENIKHFNESLTLSLNTKVHIIMGTSFMVSPFNMLSYENKDPHLKVFVINNQPIQYYPANEAEVIQIIGDTSEILKELLKYL